ncbi:M14 family zinc carboxypeptidase [Streptomyces sp. NPDC020667]|uniref:M14 family metallopeptidase n=1 Tax=Streptomyces sp. NPDC020667 TaxID=3154895 RepID=UPI0033DD26A6
MRRRARPILAAASLMISGLAAAPFAHAQPAPGTTADSGTLSVWTAKVTSAQIPLLLAAGIDGHELGERVTVGRTAPVELTLTPAQAAGLRGQGVDLTEKRVPRKTQERLKATGDGVFRPYGPKGGLEEEIVATARAHPGLAKVVSIGKTVRGQDILALKVTKDATRTRDGARPAVLYMSNQHAREWITPEMTRRLMHHYVDDYGKDDRITRLVDRSELWFLLSANPDGYDYTFQSPDTRLWRKNLRDNDGDGKITSADGVDLNRNFPYKWGYDNEGSSPRPTSETYRGPSPASEPETRALDAFEKRVHFRYAINYHSAAELLLYGVGWQVATPTPDDVLYKALAGTPEKSAIPGYRPQLSSELYTTNGEADGHAANVNGTMMFTPEMSTCETAAKSDPDHRWDPADCRSSFTFPDDEKLIQREFTKNLPFALSVAETAANQAGDDQPVSSVGLSAPDFTPDTFTTSYARGEEQDVAVTVRKSVRDKRLNYRIDGGRTHTAPLEAWEGGKRYGGRDNLRFDQYRAQVEGADPGSRVQVWFTGRTREGRPTASEPFTYSVAQRPRADTLVLADEGGTTAARSVAVYTKALADNGRRAAVWDVARQGAPHALGVLGHFGTVVWYSGANRPGGETLLAVRDFINAGGKVVAAGQQAGGSARVGAADTDDFSQYYLGAGGRVSYVRPPRFDGTGELKGTSAVLADAPGSPLTAAGAYSPISDELPPADFPQFRSAPAGDYSGVRSPFQPYAGSWMAAARHRDSAWMRLARTVDLTGAKAADRPALGFWLSHDTEQGYDNAVVEVHTVGRDDWTTLPDARGGTTDQAPLDCGSTLALHPFLAHYLTLRSGSCVGQGSTGGWHAFTGSSGGWRQVSFDLGAYAGRKIEVAVSYVTDPGSGGRGVFVDDATVTVGGTAQPTEGFETSLVPWTVPGPPAGSPGNAGDWARSRELGHYAAAVTTSDTALLGFGLEHVSNGNDRARLLGNVLHAIDR